MRHRAILDSLGNKNLLFVVKSIVKKALCVKERMTAGCVVSAAHGPETEARARQGHRCRHGARRFEHAEGTENQGMLGEALP